MSIARHYVAFSLKFSWCDVLVKLNAVKNGSEAKTQSIPLALSVGQEKVDNVWNDKSFRPNGDWRDTSPCLSTLPPHMSNNFALSLGFSLYTPVLVPFHAPLKLLPCFSWYKRRPRACHFDRPDQLPLRNKLFVGNFGSMLALCSFPHIKISSRYRKLCRISSECITDEGYKCESELEKNDDPKRSVLFKFRSKSGNFNLSELVRELSHDFSI